MLLAIAAGRHPPGARLVESDLAAELGTSRVPVREALQELALYGVLTPAGARGWRVADFDERQIEETYQIRVALERLMLVQAAPVIAAEPTRIENLRRRIDEMRRAARERDAMAINRLDLAFHREALAAADHALGLKMWEGISRHVQIIFGMELYRDPDLEAVTRQHEALLAALLAGDAAALEREIERHIRGYRSLTLRRRAAEAGVEDRPAHG